jgi:hypothetical protein
MARRREEEEPRRTRTIVQRVVVPVERVYDRARRRVDGMNATEALKYLAWSAGTGIATHFATRGIKTLVGATGDTPKHDPLWVSVPAAAVSIIAATQLEGTAQAIAIGAAIDSTGQLASDAYHHFKRPADESPAPQLPAAPQAERRNATADQLAAAYEAARRELAAQQLNAYAQAQQQAAMYGPYGYSAVPMY